VWELIHVFIMARLKERRATHVIIKRGSHIIDYAWGMFQPWRNDRRYSVFQPMSFRLKKRENQPRKRGEKQQEIICDILILQRFRSP